MQISKYSASGNDFVIFHTFKEVDRSELAKKLCHRQKGIGADGLIVLLPHEKYDFKWQFYNNDGSHASMCGNGTRAAAHYAYTNNLAHKNMSFLTDAGVICSKVDEDMVESQMVAAKKLSEPFSEFEKQWYFYDTGVPHLVTFVDDLSKSWKSEEIIKMRQKYNANVNFVKLGNPLHVRTFERGVEAETLACGTGMVASFLAAFHENKLESHVKILPKSEEMIEVKIENNELFLKGAVKKVFDTTIDENKF